MRSKNNIDDLLKGLSHEEKEIALKALHDFQDDGKIYKALYSADYREIPVSPKEFLDNPEYFNHIGKQAYEIWRNHFININSDGKKYYIILTGSIGCGKDFFTYLLLAYEIYKIACLKNPHKFFDRAENRNIVFSLISITKTQTKKVLFEPLKNALDGSPWFQKNFPRNKDKNDIIEFTSPADDGSGRYGKITVEYGAPNNASVIGEDVFTAAMDEANFMQVIEKSKKVRGVNKEYNQAKLIHDNILRRMESRFLKNGRLPGKLIVLSSRQYPDDFVETKINEVRDKEYAVVCEHSFYEVKRKDFSDEEFKVLIGTERYSSRILKEGEDVDDPEAKIINIPIDFYNQFETDIDGAIRDIAGCATLTVRNFLRDRAKVFACVKPDIENPFTSITTTLEDGNCLMQNILNKMDKSPMRTIHLDLSSSGDATGFCMAHVAGVKEVEHFTEKIDAFGKTYMGKVVELLPVYKVDLALQIIPPKGGEIKYSLIRQLIYDLRDAGFFIRLITADKYQSKDMLQILNDNGFETAYISCDTSTDPYYNLRTAIYEGRFEIYSHHIFEDEIVNLEEDTKKHKIDHRQGKCFTGDTKIKLLDGTTPTLKELYESNKKEFWVYSCKEDGTIVPAIAKNCRITDTVTSLLEITLDNGSVIKCTENHPFMLKTGKYKKAKDLLITDSLMPLYYRYYGNNHKMVSIKKVLLDCPIDVYDIEVPIYDNFALEAGIFVHNSKDVSDAISGALWSLAQLEIVTSSSKIMPSFGISVEPEKTDSSPSEDCELFETEFVEECSLGTLTNEQLKLYTDTGKLTKKQRALLNLD